MKLVLPFEKNIKLDTAVKEICSISLEHEITKNEDEILGNFIIDGTYKEHELSINEIPFNYVLPFSVDLDKKVNVDTIDFTIDNFTYDLKDDNLYLKVEYIINAEEVEMGEEIRKETNNDMDISYFFEEDSSLNTNNVEEVNNEDKDIQKENNSFDLVDDFVCYHMHIVKENETFESIAALYNCDASEIKSIKKDITKDDHVIVPIKYV